MELEEKCKNPSSSEMEWKLKNANDEVNRFKTLYNNSVSKNTKNMGILYKFYDILAEYNFENIGELITYLNNNPKPSS